MKSENVKNLLVSDMLLSNVRKEIRKTHSVKETKELIEENKYLRVAYRQLKKKTTKKVLKLMADGGEIQKHIALAEAMPDLYNNPYQHLSPREYQKGTIVKHIPALSDRIDCYVIEHTGSFSYASAHITIWGEELTKEQGEALIIHLKYNQPDFFNHLTGELPEKEDTGTSKLEYYNFKKPTDVLYDDNTINSTLHVRKFIHLDSFWKTKDTGERAEYENTSEWYDKHELEYHWVDITKGIYVKRKEEYDQKKYDEKIASLIEGEYHGKAKPEPGESSGAYLGRSFGMIFVSMNQDQKYKDMLEEFPEALGVSDGKKLKRIRNKYFKTSHPDITKDKDTQEFLILQGKWKFIIAYATDTDNSNSVAIKQLN